MTDDEGGILIPKTAKSSPMSLCPGELIILLEVYFTLGAFKYE